MTNRLTPAAAAFIMRLWRNGTVATLNTKGKTGAVNNSHWLTPEQLPSVSLASNDLYFSTSTASQIPPTNAAGKQCDDRYKRIQNAYLASINALYTEFDFKDFASAEATTEHVSNLPHPPSIIINSGGGLHCYWLLDVTHYCNDESSRERLKTCIRAFVTANGGDTGAKDLARVLRVPDTLNTKYTPPRPVSFVRCDYTLEYQFETLEAWALSKCPPPPAHPKRERVAIPTTATSDKATARAAKYFNVTLARRCDELQATPVGKRYDAIGKHATAVGGYCHLMPNDSGEQIAREALSAACSHYDNQPKVLGWIEAALRYGIAHPPKDIPDFTAPPKRTQQQTENDCASIAQLRAAIEAQQWHGKATITTSSGKAATIKLVSAYRVLSYALDIATEQTYNRVLLSARSIATNTRMYATRASHCIQYLRERGYLKTIESSDNSKAGIYRVDVCKTTTPITQLSSVGVLHRYKSASCSRRVTIVTEHERMLGEGARRRYANGPTLDDCPLANIKPKADWKGAHLLRTEPTKEHTTYDGLGEMARHVLDLLTAQPHLKRDLASITGVSMDTVRRVLKRLEQAEIVVIGDDRRNESTRLSDDWNTALNKFYELGNIAEHQRRIATRCERERLAWRERLENNTREKMSDDERLADIALTVAEATLDLSPTPETQLVTGVTIASDDERSNALLTRYVTPECNEVTRYERAPTPAPAPATINIVAAWLIRLADIAEDVSAGNPHWIPKREIPASEFDAVRNKAMSYNINLIDASATFYQVRAAA